MTFELTEPAPHSLMTAEELIDFVIVGSEAVQAFKAKLRACNKSEKAKIARDQALTDGRKISRLVLDAESRLGELLEQIPYNRDKESSTKGTSLPSLPVGINKKESHCAQEIYRHPGIVQQVWNDKQNDIPTRHDVLKAIRNIKHQEKVEAQRAVIEQGLEAPEGEFDIIVIDPPWEFDTDYDSSNRRSVGAYPTMTYAQVQAIELPAKNDCILWLWTTHKDIWKAKEILENWGFSYKGMIVWNKEKMGIGTWLRFQCEFCLLGIKGKPLWEHHDIRDYIVEARTTHSTKPEAFYSLIDSKFIGRKLDYFGRKPREGWSIYGTNSI